MTAFFVGLILGAALGAVAVGVLANRKPQWFAKVVAVANAVDAKVNNKIENK